MAKLKGPLFSLGATNAIGKALVYFPWKGLNVVRTWVQPANPNTTAQQTQRGYMQTIVALIHDVEALGAAGLTSVDTAAYALYGSTLGLVMTWFNAVVRQCLKQKVALKHYAIYYECVVTPGVDLVNLNFHWYKEFGVAEDITAGTVYYGTSKTALINAFAANVVADLITANIVGLVTGTKYYFQFRSTAHADFDGTRSGIYHGTPT